MTLGEAVKSALLKAEFKREDFRENIFPYLADTAQKKIAFVTGGIKRVIKVGKDDERTISFDENFYGPSAFFVRKCGENRYVPYYCMNNEDGTKSIVICEDGEFEVHYYAMPQTITEETPLDYEFEVPERFHFAIPFYITYEIAKNDDTIIAQTALNEWNSMLLSFRRKPKSRNMIIEDVYGGV